MLTLWVIYAQTLLSHFIWRNPEFWVSKLSWTIVRLKNPDFREVKDRAFGYYPVYFPEEPLKGKEKEGWGTNTALLHVFVQCLNQVDLNLSVYCSFEV